MLRRLHRHLAPSGRAAFGFAAGRGYEFDEFFRDADGAGFTPGISLSTWDLCPLSADSDFLVSILRPA